MTSTTTLIYDGSFEGFLTAVFTVFERKLENVVISASATYASTSLFCTEIQVFTEKDKAERVWNTLVQKIKKKQYARIFQAFLSEQPGIENTLLRTIQYIFSCTANTANDYSHPDILAIAQITRKVHRERHRMEAFIRFEHTKDDTYVATIEPDFNVIPLLSNHFEKRYADQKWLIYDVRRSYGIYYDLKKVEVISFLEDTKLKGKISSKLLSDKEKGFQKLWKTYYTNVNIASRNNKKLHFQHVPKRYWKYLTEKHVI